MARLTVEFFYDHEVDLWGYVVPVLNIVGTGCKTRSDAERYVIDAIEFTLETDEAEDPDSEVVTYDVQIAKAS